MIEREDLIRYLAESGYESSFVMETVEIKTVSDAYLVFGYLTRYDHHPKSMAIPMESLKRYVRDRKIEKLLD